MTLDDFKRLNPKDIGSWPWIPKIAILFIVVAAILFLGFWFDWRNQLDELNQAREEESKLKEIFKTKKLQAINLETYQQQLKDIEQSFGALLKQLPNKSEMEALLTDINQAGLGRGLQFELFKPASQERMADFYAELPINIRITGNYHDIGAFASDIALLPRIVTLNDLNIISSKDGLTMDALARTFRYLDEEEISQQKKAAKAAKEAKK